MEKVGVVKSIHAGHEKKIESKKRRKKKSARLSAGIWPDQTRQVSRQAEGGGTNQPPLVGSAKQTWPGVEEVEYIRSIRSENKEKEGEKRHTHTRTHTTQGCQISKPAKLQ